MAELPVGGELKSGGNRRLAFGWFLVGVEQQHGPRDRTDVGHNSAVVDSGMFCSPRSPNKQRECTGKYRQFNGFGLVQPGSGPGGRWFKSTRPDQF